MLTPELIAMVFYGLLSIGGVMGYIKSQSKVSFDLFWCCLTRLYLELIVLLTRRIGRDGDSRLVRFRAIALRD